MFVDRHTLANMQRQGRAVHEFLHLHQEDRDDIYRVMDDAGVRVPTNLKRRTVKFAPRDSAQKRKVVSRLHAKQKKSTKNIGMLEATNEEGEYADGGCQWTCLPVRF